MLVPLDAAMDAARIIMALMEDHPHRLIIEGPAIEEMRAVYQKIKDANPLEAAHD